MERLKLGLQTLVSPSSDAAVAGGGGGGGGGFFDNHGSSAYPDSAVLIRRAPGRVVSLWTCSKISAISFAVGIVVGFTLKRRLRQWAAKVLKRMRDD